MNLDQMEQDARKRLREAVNRSAGQHSRAIKAGFAALIPPEPGNMKYDYNAAHQSPWRDPYAPVYCGLMCALVGCMGYCRGQTSNFTRHVGQ